MSRRRKRGPDGKRILVKAVLRLPTDLRDVLLLHRMAGLSCEQIGAHLGMETGVVQAHLAEALAQLIQAIPRSKA